MTGLFHSAAVAGLPLLPRPIMRILASRYIAGETLEQALVRIRALESEGFQSILDILGEDVTGEAEARAVVRQYAQAATVLAEAGHETYVSVKPTHLGLRSSEKLATELFIELVEHCSPLGMFVRVEMEDHTTTAATLRIYEALRPLTDKVGIVLQSRLYRTPDDIDALAPGPIHVRMVKGIYLEPAEVAHVAPDPISEAYVACTRQIFERGGYVSLATHDEPLANELLALTRSQGLGHDRYEFQVLMGVCEHLWRKWKAIGESVRVYVPYGPDWRAYSTRRLKHNPQILQHVMRDFLLRR